MLASCGVCAQRRTWIWISLRALRAQQESKVLERLETALRDYWDATVAESQESPLKNKTASVRDLFAAQSKRIFAVTEELGKLNEENFEARRRELSRAVENLQNDIWETMLTALCLGAIIAEREHFPDFVAGEGIGRIPERHQTSGKTAAAAFPATGFVAGAGKKGAVARAARRDRPTAHGVAHGTGKFGTIASRQRKAGKRILISSKRRNWRRPR